jgi:Fe2+ transport system protein FeoA
MDTVRNLSQLNAGDDAVIARFLSDDPALRRFRELGLLPGTAISVVRRAPLGDPIEISVRGSLLSIRNEQAALIGIEVSVSEDAPAADA